MGPLALAGLAGLGLGTGYLGDKFLGDGDYSPGEAAADSIMGLVGGGFGGQAAKYGGKFLTPVLGKVLPKGYHLYSPAVGRAVTGTIGSVGKNVMRGLGASSPFLQLGGESAPDQSPGLIHNGFAGIPGLFANFQEEPAPVDPYAGFDAYWRKLRNQYKPAEFQGKDMMGYMEDPRAQAIVDDNIAVANRPHREAIRDEKRQLKNDLHNISVLEKEYQRAHGNTVKQAVENSKNIQKGHAAAVSDVRADADEALNNILAMYNTADDKSQREIATSAAENRVDAPDAGHAAAAMAEVNNDRLSEMGAISALQAEQSASDRRAEASDSIRASRRGIASNAAQRRGMIAELAKSLASDDLQKFGLDIDNAGRRNSFLAQAVQMYPSFGAGASDPYAEAFYKRAGDLAARQQYGVPVEVTQETEQGGQVTMQVPQSVFETQASRGYYGGPLQSAYGG